MALGSQQGRVELMADLTGLTHDIFVGDVVPNVRRESITAMLIEDAEAGTDYRLEGQNMVGAVDLLAESGAMATDGKLPDHVGLDPVQFKITPIRRYRRVALDNMVEMQASGPGAFRNLGARIFDTLWKSWKYMTIRQAIGASDGVVCKVASRTSSTKVIVKDGYGNAGTNPLSNLSRMIGAPIAWYDVNVAAIGGAAKILTINESTKEIELDSAATWETEIGNITAVDDTIFFATTNDTTKDYFVSERNLAPNGLGTILDPQAALTTVFNISQTTHPNWKPFRKSSATFDHLEVTEHWLQLGAKRGFDVTPQTDVAITYGSAAAQLARGLMAFQQQAYTGEQLKGGYNLTGGAGNDEDELPHAGLVIAGIPVYVDGFFYHNVLATLCREKIFRINLGGDADFWAEDGSMWQRIADFDGKEAFVAEYLQYVSNHRGCHGALTSIVTPDVTADDFSIVPDY